MNKQRLSEEQEQLLRRWLDSEMVEFLGNSPQWTREYFMDVLRNSGVSRISVVDTFEINEGSLLLQLLRKEGLNISITEDVRLNIYDLTVRYVEVECSGRDDDEDH